MERARRAHLRPVVASDRGGHRRLMDDPVAADLATEAAEPAAQLWTEAARDRLANAALATSARRCLAIAAGRVPAELRPAVADVADLVESGRCPGDLLAERAGGAAEYIAGTFRQAC